MVVLLTIVLLLASLYLGWVIWLYMIWRSANTSRPTTASAQHLTIIIPFRDETQTLPMLWNALLPQLRSSPGAAVIFINDHSSDDSAQVIARFAKDYPLIEFVAQSQTHGKKAGVDLGVDLAKTDWITSLDADTIPDEQWLKHLAAYTYGSSDDLFILPLHIGPSNSCIGKLQEVEFLSVMGVTASMAMAQQPVLCNGANLCFRREAYAEVRSMRTDMHITSGDDLFLLQALKPRNRVRWIHNPRTTVHTSPQNSWPTLIAQRLRWMGKTVSIENRSLQITARLTFLMNAIIVIGFFTAIAQPILIPWYILLVLSKAIVDGLLITAVGNWMCIKQVKRFYFVLIFLYPFYATLLPVISMIYKPAWKGRTTHIKK
jgi:biofilm PGA synthesis N-glycosyltransferase PgaC